MKLINQLAFSVCAMVLFMAPVSAQYLFPYSGWWGAGYSGNYGYAAYPSYTSYYAPPSYGGCCGSGVSVYSASYGSSCGNGCCLSPCCDACGSGCASGACASGSCAGVVPSQSLKPAEDPISNKPEKGYEDENPRKFNPVEPRDRRPRNDQTDPLLDEPVEFDAFDKSKTNSGSGTGAGSGLFQENLAPVEDRLNNKPAIPDPLDSDPVDPDGGDPGKSVDEKTFYDGSETDPNKTTSRMRDAVLARGSSLTEVISPKRLASRSLPFVQHPVSSSKLAQKYDAKETETQRPLRWISAPTGQIRL